MRAKRPARETGAVGSQCGGEDHEPAEHEEKMNANIPVTADFTEQCAGWRKATDGAAIERLMINEDAGCGAKAQKVQSVEAAARRTKN